MTMPYLSMVWLEEVDRTLREAAMNRTFAIEFLTNTLERRGFRKIRFFEFSECLITDESSYILKHVGSDITVADLNTRTLPAAELHMGSPNSQVGVRTFVGGDPSQANDLIVFQSAIGAERLPTIFVPIHAGNDLVAKLCLSWTGDVAELGAEDIAAVSILARLCGRYIRLSHDFRLADAANQLENIPFQSVKTGYVEAHEAFLKLVEKLIPCYSSAVFEHNWSNDAIEKVSERFHMALGRVVANEKYYRGRSLTGTALDSEMAYLVNSHNLSKVPETIYEEALNGYQDAIPTDVGLLYSRFESGHRDFVLRLISRTGGLTPCFSNLDKDIVARLCRRFSYYASDFANQQNLTLINDIFQISISDFSRYTNVIERFEEMYERVFESGVVLIAMGKNAKSIDYVYAAQERSIRGATRVEPEKLLYICNQLAVDKVTILPTGRFNDMIGVELLAREEGSYAFLLLVEDAELSGIVYTVVHSENNSQQLLTGITEKTRKTLNIIAAIIASSISASAKHITTENAKRLIGHIGHEIETPVAKVGNLSQAALERTKLAIPTLVSSADESGRQLTLTIDGALIKIQNELESISMFMDVALDMAQETHSRLDVTYRPFNLFEVLHEVSETAKREMGRYQMSGTRCHFEFNDACKRINNFVGDRVLIEKIFLNLFRNALKYSYPPGKGAPIIIRVHANPQTSLLDINVINWGVPLREVDFGRIFKAFERGEARDPVRARRGMGLGLYVARRFAEAHSGTVVCKSSEPTLDDPDRRGQEGWTTTFSVRLSRNLSVSTSEVRFR